MAGCCLFCQIVILSFETGKEVFLHGGNRLSAQPYGGLSSSSSSAAAAVSIAAADMASDHRHLAVACAKSGTLNSRALHATSFSGKLFVQVSAQVTSFSSPAVWVVCLLRLS